MKTGYYFYNTIFANTDSFGSWNEESVPLGLVNYGDKKLGRYFSFDEIKKLLSSGFKDDNIVEHENIYKLISSYCSSCNCFSIYCGKVLHDTKYINLLEYAKKIGLVHDEFIPIKGWKGIKTMEEVNGKFNVYYMVEGENMNNDFLSKICVGKIKKLAGSRINCYRDNGLEIEIKFICDDVYFDKQTSTLKIIGIPLKYVNNDLSSAIKLLDLELWMLYNEDKHWSRFFSAATELVRDCGQDHWFSSLKRDEPNNIEWSEVQLGETFQKK